MEIITVAREIEEIIPVAGGIGEIMYPVAGGQVEIITVAREIEEIIPVAGGIEEIIPVAGGIE